jgi:DNA helicase-2/ATP-dependent DNA helicase PcrA
MHPAGDDLLGDLDESQRAAVTSAAAPLAILAGAGSGKTRVLTRRIAWQAQAGGLDAEHVLAVTFTRKAAGELASRLARLGVERAVTAGTIHSVALASLRRRSIDRDRPMPGILERKARLLVPLVGGRGQEARLAAAEVASEIEWAKARLVPPDAYELAAARAGRETQREADAIALIYERYEHEKRKRRVVDFDDLLWWCAEYLETDPEFAAAQRWRFRHLFVDEFQDVSPAQVRLLRGWLGDRPDLCVVGDPDQAIYSFSGADPSFLTGFRRHFPGGDVVRLGCNYRSTPEVLAVAEAVLADGGRPRPVREAVRAAGPHPVVTEYDSDDDEAAGVADLLRDAHSSGVAWSALAVLYRTNAQSAAFEEALGRAGIPVRVRGAGRFLERPEVKAALEQLRQSAHEAPGRTFADHLADLEAGADDATEERREHVDALARLGREYLAIEGGAGSVAGFTAHLGTALRAEAPDVQGEAVELLTFHRAKGLEFHTVFVTGLERGLVPISHAETHDERAEERRLLYVALTRAEQILQLSYARTRTLGSRVVNRARSPWLAPIEQVITPPGAEPPKAQDLAGQLAKARRALGKGSGDRDRSTDDPLFGALAEWRRNLARASGVPAYVIFNDRTLHDLVESKPTSKTALLTINGIGPVKAERHGDAVLDLVRRHSA